MYGQNFPSVQERRIVEIERKLEDVIKRLDEMKLSKEVTPSNVASVMKEQNDEIVTTATITEEIVIKTKPAKKKTSKKKKS